MADDGAKKIKVNKLHPFEVTFGLPWTWDTFVSKAVQSQRPFLKGTGVQWELQMAIDQHAERNNEQLWKYRLDGARSG